MASIKTIKGSLLKQLKDMHADVSHFESLIDDYVWCWKQEQSMQKDINKNGRTSKAWSAAGREYDKDNPSVKNVLLYNKQKLAILKELGLNTQNVAGESNDPL